MFPTERIRIFTACKEIVRTFAGTLFTSQIERITVSHRSSAARGQWSASTPIASPARVFASPAVSTRARAPPPPPTRASKYPPSNHPTVPRASRRVDAPLRGSAPRPRDRGADTARRNLRPTRAFSHRRPHGRVRRSTKRISGHDTSRARASARVACANVSRARDRADERSARRESPYRRVTTHHPQLSLFARGRPRARADRARARAALRRARSSRAREVATT